MDHTKPSGHESQRIISQIHVSRKIKSANHASREYSCTTLYTFFRNDNQPTALNTRPYGGTAV